MKKRKFLGFLATALLCVLFTALSVQAETTLRGEGTSDKPYQISNAADFAQLANASEGKYFMLMEDVTLSSWNSINFDGIFRGNDKTISGLKTPLFGTIGAKGTVSNLTIENAIIEVTIPYVGAICNVNEGLISSCNVVESSITGTVSVGGICGDCPGTVTGCNVSGCTITGSNAVGGICGSLPYYGNVISNCTNSGGSVVGKTENVGGICGSNSKSITNCNNSSSVQGEKHVGGISGGNTNEGNSSITGCVNSGTVNGTGMTTEEGTADNSYIGGVCGQNLGTIKDSSSKAPEKESETTKPDETETKPEETEKKPEETEKKPEETEKKPEGTTTPTTPSTPPELTAPDTTTPSTTPGTTTPTTPSDTTQPGATTPTETAPSVVTPNPTPETTPTVNVPAPKKVQKIAAGNTKKQAVVLTWKKDKDAKGYQIEYSLNKKFTKQKKVKNAKKTSVTIKKLKKGKTYFFRVRAFKVVNGKMICGKWSAVKKIRIKK